AQAAGAVPQERLPIAPVGPPTPAHDLAGVVQAAGLATDAQVRERPVLPQHGTTVRGAGDLTRVVDRAGAERAEIDDGVARRAAIFQGFQVQTGRAGGAAHGIPFHSVCGR